MSLRVGRLLIATPIAELFAVAGLLVPGLVAFAMMKATVTARMFEMQAIAQWSAPLAGFLFCSLAGWWVARRASTAHERNGLALGIAVAAIDMVLLVASGAPFGLLTVSSVASRIVGGYVGGAVVRHGMSPLAARVYAAGHRKGSSCQTR